LAYFTPTAKGVTTGVAAPTSSAILPLCATQTLPEPSTAIPFPLLITLLPYPVDGEIALPEFDNSATPAFVYSSKLATHT
jgi:hypothetical protein